MTPDQIIMILLSIIGVLITALVTLLVNQIRIDIKELKDMFVRHVRNYKIHTNMPVMEEI